MRGAQGERRDLAEVRRRAQAFAFLSAPVDTPSCGSLGYNQLCGVNHRGRGTYTTKGITKLCEGLKGSAVTSLRCADAPKRSPFCQRPLTLLPSFGSLCGNQLCGIDQRGNGTYTTEGIAKLCEVLKGSGVTSLECAAAPQRLLSCQRPLTLLTTSHTPLLAVCEATASVPREQPLSPRASRATRRCNRSSRPLGARTRAPECLPLCQRPLTLVMSHRPHPFPCCSLSHNNLTNVGQDMSGLLKLVEILPQTKIESLECAPAPKCSAFCQRPLTRSLSHHLCSTLCAVSVITRSEPRAPPRSLPSSRRRRSPPSSAPPP